MDTEQPLDRTDIDRMVHHMDDGWEVTDVTPIARGFSRVYRVVLDRGVDRQRCILKVTPADEAAGISAEARLLAIIETTTSIPVPSVIGVVDDVPDLQTPFVLMDHVQGGALDYQETRHLSDGVLERIARQSGAYLAELHDLDAVDGFGRVWWDGTYPCTGEQPPPAIEQLCVIDRTTSWQTYLRSMAEDELDRLQQTAYRDLASPLRACLFDRIDRLPRSLPPVLGRVDHGVHNLLIDTDTGDIRSMIDWGFTLAVTPGYDRKTVEWVLSGAVLTPLANAADRRAMVREALIEGYREVSGTHSLVDEDEALYELLAIVRAMNHLEAGIAKVPQDATGPVGQFLRGEVEAILEDR